MTYGSPTGLRARLAQHRVNLSDRSYPWMGLGLVADLELIMQILNKREWLQSMAASADPDAQEFARELLDDDETLDAVQLAAGAVRTVLDRPNPPHPAFRMPAYDPVATIEQLDGAALAAQRTTAAVREALVRAGVADDATTDDELPALLQALLA